jgi:GAF domain-containing protein
VKGRILLRYGLIGLGLGLLIPLLATLAVIFSQRSALSLLNIIQTQINNPLLWIVDTTLLFSGFLALLCGASVLKVKAANDSMTGQIHLLKQKMINLENVHTGRELNIVRQVAELKTAAQIAREVAGIRKRDQLLDQTVQLMAMRFGFFCSSIFLIDDRREYAVLSAASPWNEEQKSIRSQQIMVGENNLVGTVTARGQSGIVIHEDNPRDEFASAHSPTIHSEAAVPLIVHGEILGALEVLSSEDLPLSQDDIDVLQIVADQVALALENIRLQDEGRQAFSELETHYKQQAFKDWRRRLAERPLAYAYDRLEVRPLRPLNTPSEPETEGAPLSGELQPEDQFLLQVPIELRGQRLGRLTLRRKTDSSPWQAEEKALAEEVVSQVALALENARLLEEMQRQAMDEQLIQQISSTMRQTLDLDTILQTAAVEIYQALGLHDVTIKLKDPQGSDAEGIR